MALRPRQGRVHRLDDGREPQHEGHRDGQRHQQPGAHHRQHRPRRRGAVLDHRPVQRDGHARGRLRVEPARLPQVRERSRPRGAGRRCGTCRSSAFRRRAAWRIPTSSRRRSRSRSARSGSSPPIRSSRSRTSARCSRRSRGSSSSSCRTAITRRRPPSSPHLMLPAAIWGEKEGTYTNSERRVSKVNRAVDAARRGARPTSTSSSASPTRSACATSSFPAGRTPGDAFEEWKRVSAGRLCDYSGMTYEAIEQHGGIQWPFPAGATDPRRDAAALRRRRVPDRRRPRAADSRRRGSRFPSSRTTEFPLVLNTGRTVEHWHTRTKTGKVPILERLSPNAWLEMNPRDARGLRLQAAGPRGRRLAARPRARRRAARHRDDRARARSSCRSTTPRPTRTR